MTRLAIKGHPTRGSEIIALLEMLGGVNKYNLKGNEDEWYVLNGKQIQRSDSLFAEKGFTLEQFLEKYPYKVGDKVSYVKYNDEYPSVYTIQKIRWTGATIEYLLGSSGFSALTKDLQPYKEETMETITIDDFKANTKEWLIDKLESMSKDNALQAICNIHDELQKSKYPQTCEECLNVLGKTMNSLDSMNGYKFGALMHLQQLLICRDAYWKIAGDEMGLGKPWEPDWLNNEQDKYVLFTHNNAICSNRYVLGHNILAFPTKVMRDTFYENFKDLIEECKEFL